ncbi:hypothetical protein E2C01_017357 [Portunus trituberculatus]|uniref:Uncharacterized protein n=1 Tax=Portunus trituberculatus TaxID=210409 RepID=A0A5B7DT54_PORTR|nr:hypothetical protein [Portunus trituberculatus]
MEVVRRVIEHSPTDSTCIGFLPCVYSQVVAEDGLEGEDFGAEGAGMGPAYSAQRRNALQEREGLGLAKHKEIIKKKLIAKKII